ncbi:MAG: hypothetical protein F8N15_03590 [Methanobacterium sp.]|nr:hypothetical protein [Methanobacterium sp.]
MSTNDFSKLISRKQKELEQLQNRTLPIKIGAIAKAHFQNNFRLGGFVDNGLHAWKPSKRLSYNGKSTKVDRNNKTLLSSRNHLFSSIEYTYQPGLVIIKNEVPYAAVHNYGFKAGRGKGFQMPKRQFIGPSAELNQKVEQKIYEEVNNIMKH